MVVKAKVKSLQEAMSNILPPSPVQADSLSDMLLSIYRDLWWYMCPSSALIQLITVTPCIEYMVFLRSFCSHKVNYNHISNCRDLATQPEDSLTRDRWHYSWDVYSDSWNKCAVFQDIRSGCQRDRIGLNKQFTNSAENVTLWYSTVKVISCVHPKCLLSDAANNTDRILESCWFIITFGKHQWNVCYHLWYSKFKQYFQMDRVITPAWTNIVRRKDACIVNYCTIVTSCCSWIKNVHKKCSLYMTVDFMRL